jgi:hypothetical protein
VIYHDSWTWHFPDFHRLYQDFLDALPRNSPYSPHFQELPSVFALWEDCEKLFEKYPQADRTPRDRFATMDDAALASYLTILSDSQGRTLGTMWGHSTLGISAHGGGLEWGAVIDGDTEAGYSFRSPNAGSSLHWAPPFWERVLSRGAAYTHTHGFFRYPSPELKASGFRNPAETHAYFSSSHAEPGVSGDVGFVNRFGRSMYLLNDFGEFMRLDYPAHTSPSRMTANPMDGTAVLLRSIPLPDLLKLNECAKAGIRR